MQVDLDLACALIAHHLSGDGLRAKAVGTRVAIQDARIELRMRRDTEPRNLPDTSALNDLLWVDVDGIIPGRTMSLDIGAWGMTPEDAAMDAAHGVIESILPGARWLANEPGFTPRSQDGTFLRIEDVEGGPWMCFSGRPWIKAVSFDEGLDVQALAGTLRQKLDKMSDWVILGAGGVIGPAVTAGEPHWVKVMVMTSPNDDPSGRLDIDNRVSFDASALANAIPWPEGDATSLVRQLVAIRAEQPVPAPVRVSRLSRLLRH